MEIDNARKEFFLSPTLTQKLLKSLHITNRKKKKEILSDATDKKILTRLNFSFLCDWNL